MSRTDDEIQIESGTFSVVVDADSEVRSVAADVEVRFELRSPDEDAWQLALQSRFEPKVSEDWPLHFDAQMTTGPRGTECQLHAIARDERGAIVAQAETRRSCDPAESKGLHVALKFSGAAAPADPKPPAEPDIPEQVAEQCVGRAPSVPFCDGEVIRVCVRGGTAAEIRPCGEHERCFEDPSGGARCECAPGFVFTSRGGCEMARRCTDDDAGCPP